MTSSSGWNRRIIRSGRWTRCGRGSRRTSSRWSSARTTWRAFRAGGSTSASWLVIGADNLESFPRWREHERILKEYGVAVFPRKGYHRGYLKARLMRECPDYRIELLKAPRIDISSTEIRDGLAAGRDMSAWLM